METLLTVLLLVGVAAGIYYILSREKPADPANGAGGKPTDTPRGTDRN
jgi:hypothetical protein